MPPLVSAVHDALADAALPTALLDWRLHRRGGGLAEVARHLTHTLISRWSDPADDADDDTWAMLRLAVDAHQRTEVRAAALRFLWNAGRPRPRPREDGELLPPARRPRLDLAPPAVILLDPHQPPALLPVRGAHEVAHRVLHGVWAGPNMVTAFDVLLDVFGSDALAAVDFLAPLEDSPPGRYQEAMRAALPTDLAPGTLCVTDRDGGDVLGTLTLHRWSVRDLPRLRRAARELGCWVLHLPVHAWFLSHSRTTTHRPGTAAVFRGLRVRDRGACLAPLSLARWEGLCHDGGDGDAALRHTAFFVRHGVPGPSHGVDDPGPGGRWLVAPWMDDEDANGFPEDDEEGGREAVAIVAVWSPLFGALLAQASPSCGWLLPEPLRNLPRSATTLIRLVERWLGGPMAEVAAGAGDPAPPPVGPHAVERVQRELDKLHASRDPAVRLALRLNVLRYEPAHRPAFLPSHCSGTPSPVAYALSHCHLLTLATGS